MEKKRLEEEMQDLKLQYQNEKRQSVQVQI